MNRLMRERKQLRDKLKEQQKQDRKQQRENKRAEKLAQRVLKQQKIQNARDRLGQAQGKVLKIIEYQRVNKDGQIVTVKARRWVRPKKRK